MARAKEEAEKEAKEKEKVARGEVGGGTGGSGSDNVKVKDTKKVVEDDGGAEKSGEGEDASAKNSKVDDGEDE